MSRMILLNIGNTHTQWVHANMDGELAGEVMCLETAGWMRELALLPAADEDAPVWAACVVPQARNILEKSRLYPELHFVDAANGSAAGLDFSLVDTSTLGADRIANAAALLMRKLPAACIDCGTAITMEVVNLQKQFAGGAIMPGRKLMRKSLAAGTAALPELPLTESVPEALGRNTLEAMQLGIDRGVVGMVRELMKAASSSGVNNFVAAGGDAGFFCRAIPELEAAEKEFTLRGIGFIASKHAF